MIDILVYVAVLAIVVITVWYILGKVPMPEPMRNIVTIVLVVLIAAAAIVVLLQMTGVGPPLRMGK